MLKSQAEIVAIELVGSTTVQRISIQELINRAILEKDPAKRSLIMHGISQHFRDIAWGLAGSGKRIVFIDIPSDIPEYEVVIKTKEARKIASTAPHDSEARERYRKQLSEAITLRNKIAGQQIADILSSNPGAHVLAVMGAAHHRIRDNLQQYELPIKKVSLIPRYGQEITLTEDDNLPAYIYHTDTV
ncbi:MAG: hypothetical protein WAU02_01730 [Candidatus Saccharimonadales bacterium]